MSALSPVISSDAEPLILVNEADEAIGQLPKRDCHLNDGVLHRAFSVFIFNAAGEVLLQQRSAAKLLWPGYWSNACCSHPRAGEDCRAAAQRRVKQELGIEPPLAYLYKFRYQARFNDVGAEHELCWVFAGQAEASELAPNANEIAAWRYLPPAALEEALATRPQDYTPWLRLEWPQVRPPPLAPGPPAAASPKSP